MHNAVYSIWLERLSTCMVSPLLTCSDVIDLLIAKLGTTVYKFSFLDKIRHMPLWKNTLELSFNEGQGRQYHIINFWDIPASSITT